MNLKSLLTAAFVCCSCFGVAQSPDSSGQAMPDIFSRIAKSVKEYKLDTTAPANDRVTRKIRELRNLKGAFNINEALDFKLEEDRQKAEIPAEETAKLALFFKQGDGKRWLDNATVWIYRDHFSYKELKGLVKFYKTEAGQKMATDFPLIMMQSLVAAESIKAIHTERQKSTR
jgi:hypothetical protein